MIRWGDRIRWGIDHLAIGSSGHLGSLGMIEAKSFRILDERQGEGGGHRVIGSSGDRVIGKAKAPKRRVVWDDLG